MSDARSRKITASMEVGIPAPGTPTRDPRAPVIVSLRFRYESFVDFVDSQSVNISKSGMFLACDEPLGPGTHLEFEFVLADGFAILRGKAEVMRTTTTAPIGMGVRFQELDDQSHKLIERIVEVNIREGRKPTVPLDFTDPTAVVELTALKGATPISTGLDFNGRDLRVQINTATLGYFIHNPLLNIRLGGFVVPAQEDVPLGTIFGVTISDTQGLPLFAGKGKVVAKHEMRLGIRLSDVDKATLARLQAEIAKLGVK